MRTLAQEYADTLAGLTGNEFQNEVCARLQLAILGFQTVPSKPQGDAGLDGFSHGGERGYCCYGPEFEPSKTNAQREKAIVNKFNADLQRLFELEKNGKTQLVCIVSREMATILPDGKKLNHIELIVNWFESHRILNPILSAFAQYKAASQLKYVDANASLIVVGPRDLANRYAIDADTMIRAQQRRAIHRVQQAAKAFTIDDPRDFQFKMDLLREIRPDKHLAIEKLTEEFRTNWRMSLAFESELNDTLPDLHRTLEDDRRRILRKVSELMLETDQPWRVLGKASQIAEETLKKDFGHMYGPLITDVSSGEIARLIGECPVGWDKPTTK